MIIKHWLVGAGVAFVLGLTAPVGAQMPGENQQTMGSAQAPGTIPSQRDIFVPLWTEPASGEKKTSAADRRERADFVWTGVPMMPSRPLEPAFKPAGAAAELRELRPAAAVRPGEPRRLVVVIRQRDTRAQSAPFLELVDSATMLYSRGGGRLLRRSPEETDWLFVLPDPAPPLPGARNPLSARLDVNPVAGRTFELRLVPTVSGAP